MSNLTYIGSLMKDTYEKTVKNKVNNEDYKGYISNYLREYIMYSIKKTPYADRIDDIRVDVTDDGVIKAFIEGNEFMTINLDPNIINGIRNTNNEISRFNCIIEPSIDIHDGILALNNNSKTASSITSLDSENIYQGLENAEKKSFFENSKEMFSIESGEYFNPDITKHSVLKTYCDALKIDPKMNEDMTNILVNDFYNKYKELDDMVIDIPSGDFTVEVDGKEENVTYQDMMMSQKPEIVKDNKDLSIKFNEDGSRKEFDELLNLRDDEIKRLSENQSLNEDTREAAINQTKQAYANVMYDMLLKSYTTNELLDLIKRIGYDKVNNELDSIENEKIGNLKSKGGDTKNSLDYLEKNKEKISEKLTQENAIKFEALLDNIKEDIQKQNEAISNIDKNVVSKIKEEIEKLKDEKNEQGENIIDPYTDEELKEANEERKEKRQKRKDAISKKIKQIKEKNKTKDKENPEEYDEIEETNKVKDEIEDNNKSTNKNIYTYDDSDLKAEVESLKEKIESLNQNGSVDKDIIDKIDNINSKLDNINNKNNTSEIENIREEISKLNEKIDSTSSKKEQQKEVEESINKEQDDVDNLKEKNTISTKEDTINNREINEDENMSESNNTKIEEKEDSINEIKQKDENEIINYANKEEEKKQDDVIEDTNSTVKNSNDTNRENKVVKREIKSQVKEKNEDNDTKENSIKKEYKYKDVEERVESFKEYAKHLSDKIVSKKVSEIISDDKLDVHQKAVKVGNLNDERQEYYNYIIDLVRKVTIRENSLSEYKDELISKNKKFIELQEALNDIKSIEDHLKEVEQEMNREERSNNLGK